MGSPIGNVNWVEKNEVLDDLLNQADKLTTHPMEQGFEAKVMKITTDQESFVFKVWNKSSKPDVRFQYHLLNVLSERGLSVSKPVGWGLDSDSNKVLLTSFDGTPVQQLNDKKMKELAKILSTIHRINAREIGNLTLPKYDFTDYFFPGAKEYSDIYDALYSLVPIARIKQNRLIHGDFHLSNIVEKNDRYTVIDWTNGQLGDPRYDFAWTFVLGKIYISNRYVDLFRTAYLLENPIKQEELDIFEALAFLRWLLLSRSGGAPKDSNTMKRVKSLITSNPFLRESKYSILGEH